MVRKVTLTGGVLDGKSFRVADDSETLIHHAAHGGEYRLDGASGVWVEYGEASVTLSIDTSKLDAELSAALPTDVRGLALHAQAGRRVLIVGPTTADAAELWEQAADASAETARSIRRASGDAVVEFDGGGSIRAVSARGSRYRGRSADVLYVAPGVSEAALAPVLPVLSASAVGLVLHHEAV